MNSVNDIRSHFLGYFEKNGHSEVASGPLVPRNDPTLMFTNAGMVQFKDYFTGRVQPPFPRADDLAEMRARRRQAQRSRQCRLYRPAPHLLRDARQFLLRRLLQGAGHRARVDPGDASDLGLAKDKLLVTVYADDDHAFDLWKKIAGFPDHKIIRIGTSANFWQMGDTGPCGPCSEIFIDQGEAHCRAAAGQPR